MASVEIQIPPSPEYVGVVRLALGSLARTSGMDEESIDDLRIAISEACTNAVVAAEDGGCAEPITVAWEMGETALAVSIAGVRRGDAERDVDTQGFSTRAAMSEALLKSLVDAYDVTDEGSCVTLTMNLEGRRVEG